MADRVAANVRREAIERATAEDVVSLATDVGAAPMQVGAVLLLDAADGFDAGAATRAIAERIRTVPRLRQRLVHTPPGCGRPVWVDDDRFDPDHHVRTVACPAPADEEALLAVAADVVGTRLPPDRPLWRLVVVTGLRDGRAALVIAFHHVLADGIGGLAVLANLVDGTDTDPTPDRPFPAPAPSPRELAVDAARSRLRAVTRLPDGWRRVRAAAAPLRPTAGTRASPCSLNRPTGARRPSAPPSPTWPARPTPAGRRSTMSCWPP